MLYRVFYTTDNGKKFFAKVDADSEREAEKIARSRYNDIQIIEFIDRI